MFKLPRQVKNTQITTKQKKVIFLLEFCAFDRTLHVGYFADMKLLHHYHHLHSIGKRNNQPPTTAEALQEKEHLIFASCERCCYTEAAWMHHRRAAAEVRRLW